MTQESALRFRGKILEIEGGIGVGKSTLGVEIANILNEHGIPSLYVPEHIDMPTFQKMLENPKEYAFTYQMIMLTKRIANRQHVMTMIANNPNTCIIMDRGLIGDYTFEQYHHNIGNITDEQDQLYRATMELASIELTSPDVILKIKCDVETAKNRVASRSRDGESVYTVEFLKQLENITDDLFDLPEFDHLKSIIYEWDNNAVYDYFDKKPYVMEKNGNANSFSKEKVSWVETSRKENRRKIVRNMLQRELTIISQMYFTDRKTSCNYFNQNVSTK